MVSGNNIYITVTPHHRLFHSLCGESSTAVDKNYINDNPDNISSNDSNDTFSNYCDDYSIANNTYNTVTVIVPDQQKTYNVCQICSSDWYFIALVLNEDSSIKTEKKYKSLLDYK